MFYSFSYVLFILSLTFLLLFSFSTWKGSVMLLAVPPFACFREDLETKVETYVTNKDLLSLRLSNPPDIPKLKHSSRQKYWSVRQSIETVCQRLEVERMKLSPETAEAELRIKQDLETWAKKRMWFSKSLSFSYCPISKAGSATMTQFLIKLIGDEKERPGLNPQKSTKDFRSSIRENFYSPDSEEKWKKDSLVWTMVRHPFNRLASGYYDRMVKNWSEPGIAKGVRASRDKVMLAAKGKLFDLTSEVSPSPSEFITFLLSTASEKGPHRLELSFQPVWAACPVCSVGFDAVARTEEFNNDAHFIWGGLELEEVLEVRFRPDELKPPISSSFLHHDGPAAKFYSRLEKDPIRRLYEEVFKLDFQLFQYPYPKEYVQLGKDK